MTALTGWPYQRDDRVNEVTVYVNGVTVKIIKSLKNNSILLLFSDSTYVKDYLISDRLLPYTLPEEFHTLGSVKVTHFPYILKQYFSNLKILLSLKITLN